LVAVLCVASAQAASYVMMRDEDLADQAPLIVQGHVLDDMPAADGTAAVEYRLAVERVLKGAMPGDVLTVRVPGGTDRAGKSLHLFGVPRFGAGEQVLLMLGPRPDGRYAPWQLSLGAFHAVNTAGHRLAVRFLDGPEQTAGTGQAQAPQRDFEKFSAWLAARARGQRRPADYLVAPAAGPWPNLPQAFTLLEFGADPGRWFNFDDGDKITFRGHESGMPGLPGQGFEELERALKSPIGIHCR
jgi:hypothetical protein